MNNSRIDAKKTASAIGGPNEIVRQFCRLVENGMDQQTEDDLDFLREHFDAVDGLGLTGRLGERRDAAIANCLFQWQKTGRLARAGKTQARTQALRNIPTGSIKAVSGFSSR